MDAEAAGGVEARDNLDDTVKGDDMEEEEGAVSGKAADAVMN